LCGLGPDGITSFSRIQAASDAGHAAGLMFFLFDLHLDGEDLDPRPLIERKQQLAALLLPDRSLQRYSDHVISQGPVAGKWSHSPTAPSTRWNSAASSRDASRFRHDASCGI
jgi:ATP-dependent DNA ligase